MNSFISPNQLYIYKKKLLEKTFFLFYKFIQLLYVNLADKIIYP